MSSRSPPRRRKPVSPKDISILADAMIEALQSAGGAEYLRRIAEEDPRTFCALLAKVLPQRLDAPSDNGITLLWQQDLLTATPASEPER